MAVMRGVFHGRPLLGLLFLAGGGAVPRSHSSICFSLASRAAIFADVLKNRRLNKKNKIKKRVVSSSAIPVMRGNKYYDRLTK